LKQEDAIKADIASNSCLISDRLALGSLEADFNNDEVFKAKVLKLGDEYEAFRRTRPDGNCFFRAVGFSLFELLRGDQELLVKVIDRVRSSKDEMFSLGMPTFTVEDFHDNFLETMERLKDGEGKITLQELRDTFNDEGTSNYLVVFLRLLTSKQLQIESDFYQNFLDGGRTVAEFCSTEVEPMFRESDHIHIIALTAAMGVGVRVVYLDRGSSSEGAVPHNFPEGGVPLVHLLYRPGHYDILYPKTSMPLENTRTENGSIGEESVVNGVGTVDKLNLIEPGKTIIIQKLNYMRTHLLNVTKKLQFGRDLVDLSGIVGHKYGTTFKMVSDHKNNKCFKVEVSEDVEMFEELFMNGESGEDNRDLVETDKSQKLTREEIDGMREDGVEGVEIVEKLIENSDTFQTKTKFSQAKFLKKKAKKYHQYILVRKPSIRLLMEIHYKADPLKLMNLRVDSLSQVINCTGVRSGGRYLVYETGAQGLVVAAVLERVGLTGSVAHIYQTGQPQTNSLAAMGFSSEVLANLHIINVQHLRSMEQGKDILAAHPSARPYQGLEEPASKKARVEDGEAVEGVKTTKEAKVEDGEGVEGLKVNQDLPARMNLREKSAATYKLLAAGGWDGLIIVCKQHPAALLNHLLPYLNPSRPFTVYSPYKEAVMSAYMSVKDAGVGIGCCVSETWLRHHQVLPSRTHPTVTMSGGGGYILEGIYVTG